jgi:hypothetical protein
LEQWQHISKQLKNKNAVAAARQAEQRAHAAQLEAHHANDALAQARRQEAAA